MYDGSLISGLIQTVKIVEDHIHSNPVRPSSVNTGCGWAVLNNAKLHLCAWSMTRGDVEAWFLMAEAQGKL